MSPCYVEKVPETSLRYVKILKTTGSYVEKGPKVPPSRTARKLHEKARKGPDAHVMSFYLCPAFWVSMWRMVLVL